MDLDKYVGRCRIGPFNKTFTDIRQNVDEIFVKMLSLPNSSKSIHCIVPICHGLLFILCQYADVSNTKCQ